jgi:hypothetical protein
MTKLVFTMTLTLMLIVSAAAQTGRRTGARRGSTNTPTRAADAELSNLYNKDSGYYCEEKQNIVGTIVSRKFSDDELTLVGFVIRVKDDERSFVNIDAEYVAGKGRFIPRQLSTMLEKGKRVKIQVYGCGASGALYFLDKVAVL